MEKININELGKVLNLVDEDRVLQSFENEIACLKLAEKINEIIDFLQTKGEQKNTMKNETKQENKCKVMCLCKRDTNGELPCHTEVKEDKCSCGGKRDKFGKCTKTIINLNKYTPPISQIEKLHKHLSKLHINPNFEKELTDKFRVDTHPISQREEWRLKVGEVFTKEKSDKLSDWISSHTQKVRQEVEKAFGGCKECYGKGYATTKVQAGHRGNIWELNPIRPCSCDRGKQIEKVMEKVRQEERDLIRQKLLEYDNWTKWERETLERLLSALSQEE